MPTDLEQQLARFAEALDRSAPTISFDEMVGRGTVAVDADLLELPSSDRASRDKGVSWIGTTPSHDELGERDAPIELAPALAAGRTAWPRVALKVALGVAAVVVLVVALASIEWGGDEIDPADDFPKLTTTFVSPRNAFSIRYPDGAAVTPAIEDGEDGFDVVETGLAAVFKGTSTEFSGEAVIGEGNRTVQPDEQIDFYFSDDSPWPGGCGVPRSQQAAIIIDGWRGRVAECPNRIEATVVGDGRLYVFTLSHDRSDARAVFDAFVATIDLTPETAFPFPAMTTTFVSPTYGYSFKYHDRGGLAPATERWDPDNQPVGDRNFDGRFDAVETGLYAYFEAASTELPPGVSVDAWVDEYVTPVAAGGCGVPRSQQAAITIDGQSGRIAECDHSEATVVAGGRLYLFAGPGPGNLRTNMARRNTAWFDAWVATIDLTPETAPVP